VVGTRAGAPAIARAQDAGIDTVIVSPRKLPDEGFYSAALLEALTAAEVDLICLAGYMRKLPSAVVATYPNAIMNVHAALLPLFGGQGMYGENVHRAVLESGMKVTGCTVHFVDEQYDSGPIIVQTAVSVLEDDTPESLGSRVLAEEHRALVRAVSLFAEGRLKVEGRRVHITDAPA
jgi:formyltetrahydrofolate-dependent phosphoribosylglycinamide formyltransferase